MTTTVTQGNHQNWSMVIYCQNIVLDKGTISLITPLRIFVLIWKDSL